MPADAVTEETASPTRLLPGTKQNSVDAVMVDAAVGVRAADQSEHDGAGAIAFERYAVQAAQRLHHAEDDGQHGGEIDKRQGDHPAQGRVVGMPLDDGLGQPPAVRHI